MCTVTLTDAQRVRQLSDELRVLHGIVRGLDGRDPARLEAIRRQQRLGKQRRALRAKIAARKVVEAPRVVEQAAATPADDGRPDVRSPGGRRAAFADDAVGTQIWQQGVIAATVPASFGEPSVWLSEDALLLSTGEVLTVVDGDGLVRTRVRRLPGTDVIIDVEVRRRCEEIVIRVVPE